MRSTYNKAKEELMEGFYYMRSRIIIDGNAIYEVDEECLRKKKEKEQEEEHEKQQEKRKNKT